ncbi:MAG: DUF2235 domain-containing protein [Pseudomonadota bacterium]
MIPERRVRNLVFICDGTLSSIKRGSETNAGLAYRLLAETGQSEVQRYEYDRGVQGSGWRKWLNAASGLGINHSIRRGYAFLAHHYRPGDRIFLLGYSRGAYAVRSLAGMIGRIGLLHRKYATERHVRLAFRFYEVGSNSLARQHFSAHRCHGGVEIEMLGVWDTVKSLGLPYPILNRLAPMATEFHDDQLGGHIRHGYHALAIDEDRSSYRPRLWRYSPDWQGRLEQTWFPGAHADIGGEIRARPAARSLSNIPLNWMLRRAEHLGLDLPQGWQARFPEDPTARMVGCRTGIARLFVLRAPRSVGRSDGETIHLSIRERLRTVPRYRTRGNFGQLPSQPDE